MEQAVVSPEPVAMSVNVHALAAISACLDLLLEEQKRTNNLLGHLISATNRRSAWDD
jgi:hypothetical protein